jgi:Ca-activated chloride channel family protein
MWMNGEEVEGEVVEAGKARRIYEDIVRRMRDPGLLEYVGRDLFRARVYPIPGKGDVRIKILYEEVLDYDAGLVEYRHPLKADGNRKKKIGEVSMSVRIESDEPVKSLYSPTHEIDKKIRGRRASCGFELSDEVLDRDFVLYYTVSAEDVGLNLLTHRRRGEDGYVMMLLSPGQLSGPGKIIAKDIVFVLDKSGSMKGEKIEQAKGALAYCIESLGDSDRFNIVVFSTDVTSYADGLVDVTRNEKKKALEFVEDIQARGGTDIGAALETALDLPESRRPRMIIFLTDGLPTVGETDVRRIIANLRDQNDTVRIFPFGVGYDVNTTLLDQISVDHRGAVDYIKPEEDIEVKVSRFYDKVSSPVLSDVRLNVRGIELTDVYPRQLPDIFNGSQLVVLGRYRGHGSKSITLEGEVEGESRRFVYEGSFEEREDDHAFIPRLWANRKIAYLLSEIKLHGSDRELIDEIIDLSLEYGIITPYTSYLILEEGTDGDRERLSRAAPAPGSPDLPGGGRWEEVSRSMADALAAPAEKKAVGMDAVGMSAQLSAERVRSVVSGEDNERVRYVGDKRFVLRGDEWVDEDFTDEMNVVEIEFLSDAYFDLLHEHPDLNSYLALGEKVTFVFNNQAYRITQ